MTGDRGGPRGSSLAVVPEKVNLTRAQPIDLPPVGSADKNQINLRPLIDPGCRALGKCWPSPPSPPLPPPYPLVHMITHYSKFKCGGWGQREDGKRERQKRVDIGRLESLFLMRGGEGMLLRGETMRSGRRHSKINRRNLRRDREISLTMRALVRAKWSGWG